jgi:glucose/arabinose dehydrogenase
MPHRAALAALASCVLISIACDTPTVTTIATGYEGPVHVEADGDDLLVVERAGRVWRQSPSGARALELDIAGRVFPSTDGEQGLLAIALRPGSDELAALYVDRSNATTVSIIEAHGTERVLMRVPQEREFHKGGAVEFGPDGLLYFGLGDDGTGGNAQNPSTPKGKLHRCDADTGTCEVYATGLRNPYRFGFDSLTGDLWITDVGSTFVEEINRLPAGTPPGSNFGWPEWEGTSCKTPPCALGDEVFPAYQYANDASTCAVIGGFVHRGTIAWLGGSYIFTDLCAGRLWALMGDPLRRVDVSEWLGLARISQPVAVEPDGQGRPIVVRLGGQLMRVE